MRAALLAGVLLTTVAALNAQEQIGTIVFFREPHAMSGDFKPVVFCDGKELARIENGTYFEITAPAGLHSCTPESLHGPGVIDVNVSAGNPSYVHVKYLPGWRDHAALANTSEDEYRKQKPRLKPLKEWSRNTLSPMQAEVPEGPQTSKIADSDAEEAGQPHVFLTRRKAWLASGGFNPNGRGGNSEGPDYSTDFRKRCPNLLITANQGTADYAVTIDEISLLDALTGLQINQPSKWLSTAGARVCSTVAGPHSLETH